MSCGIGCLVEKSLSLHCTNSLLSLFGLTGIYFPQCDHHLSSKLYSVHHPRKLRQSLAGNSLQHVHLLLPLPVAAGYHDYLLHPDLHPDLQTHVKKEL